MIDVKYSPYNYIVQEKNQIYEICVQRIGKEYVPFLFGVNAPDKIYSPDVFQTIEDCQTFIDREAIANNWKRALLENEVF